MKKNIDLDFIYNLSNNIIDYVKHQVPGHVLKHVNSLRTGRQIDCHVL